MRHASRTRDDDDDDEDDEVPDKPRRRPLPWLRTSVVSAGVVAALVVLAEQRGPGPASERPSPPPPAVAVAPPEPWQPIAQARPLYGLAGLEAAFEARRHARGSREDILAVGRFGEPGHALLRIRHGAADASSAGFFVDLARQAAAAGLAVVRSGQAASMTTKFGTAESASLVLAGSGEQACQAVRLFDAAADLAVHGWLCGGAPAVRAADLACILDRLVLREGDDPALTALFARAGQRRMDACGPSPRLAGIRGP